MAAEHSVGLCSPQELPLKPKVDGRQMSPVRWPQCLAEPCPGYELLAFRTAARLKPRLRVQRRHVFILQQSFLRFGSFHSCISQTPDEVQAASPQPYEILILCK